MLYYQTAISKALTYGGLWAATAVAASNAVDDAIEDALTVLTGKHMRLMDIVSVTHTPLTLNNGQKDSVCLVVTVIATEREKNTHPSGASPTQKGNQP